MRLASLIGGLVAMLAAGAEAQPRAAPNAAAEPVQVMVLGTWHFDNPGRDLNNVRADDVLVPRRQRELERVAEALARFRPTKIMVERAAPDLIDPRFAAFTPALLAGDRDERVQIAYRLAHRLGLARVHAIDEQPAPGEPDYFPFEALARYAEANGMSARLEELMRTGESETRAFEELQARSTIAELLIRQNDPGGFAGSISTYYEFLRFGGVDEQPGADLNAMWYLRNAKIFAKLMRAAEPGDRVLVVYGAGHGYWLRHFASSTPGFVSVDPRPFLRRAGS